MAKINAFHVSLFAYFLEKLKSTPEGNNNRRFPENDRTKEPSQGAFDTPGISTGLFRSDS